MKTTVKVQNLRCGGCSNSIHHSLSHLKGVFGVEVDREKHEVVVEHTDEVTRHEIVEKLKSMGYPPQGAESSMMDDLKADFKSIFSCVTGRKFK